MGHVDNEGRCTRVRGSVVQKSLYLLLHFPVNLKLSQEIKSIKKISNENCFIENDNVVVIKF